MVYRPNEEDADSSFRAGLPGASSRIDSSRIPAGDLVTVGGGPLLLLSSIVLLATYNVCVQYASVCVCTT